MTNKVHEPGCNASSGSEMCTCSHRLGPLTLTPEQRASWKDLVMACEEGHLPGVADAVFAVDAKLKADDRAIQQARDAALEEAAAIAEKIGKEATDRGYSSTGVSPGTFATGIANSIRALKEKN